MKLSPSGAFHLRLEGQLKQDRATFVLNQGGAVVAPVGCVSPVADVDAALAAVRKFSAARP